MRGKHEDLVKTDQAAMSCIDPNRRGQDRDNYNWIRDAEKNHLVVGTQARILYQDAEGRLRIALKFNEMVRRGEVGQTLADGGTELTDALLDCSRVVIGFGLVDLGDSAR